jgi:hypothetical protein
MTAMTVTCAGRGPSLDLPPPAEGIRKCLLIAARLFCNANWVMIQTGSGQVPPWFPKLPFVATSDIRTQCPGPLGRLWRSASFSLPGMVSGLSTISADLKQIRLTKR